MIAPGGRPPLPQRDRGGPGGVESPSPTSIPTAAWSIDLATDHDSRGVSRTTGFPGPSSRGSEPP